MNVYITTSNKYLHILKPFSYLFNKFWSDKQKVIILGYEHPTFDLPKNFKFVSMGEQKGPNFWAEDLHNYMSSIEDEYFICSMEDHFILDYVNFHILIKLKKYINKDVGRISLTTQLANKNHDVLESFGDTHIIESHHSIQYRLCTQWSIWNKDFMLKYLKKGMSAWDFELQGFNHPMDDEYKILGSKGKSVIIHSDAIRSTKGSKLDEYNFNALFWDYKKNELDILDKSVILDMKKKGII